MSKSCKVTWQKNIEYQLIDLVKKPPLIDYIKLVLEQFFYDKKRFLIREEKPLNLLILILILYLEKKKLNFFLSDGKLIKRPFLVYEEKK